MSKNKQAYVMTLVPKQYYDERGRGLAPACIQDGDIIEKLERFEETEQGGIPSGFYYEGELHVCPTCGHLHYILDRTDYMQGPVTIQWGVNPE